MHNQELLKDDDPEDASSWQSIVVRMGEGRSRWIGGWVVDQHFQGAGVPWLALEVGLIHLGTIVIICRACAALSLDQEALKVENTFSGGTTGYIMMII